MAEEPIASDLTLDCRKMLCPMPVYKASQALARMTSGQVLRLLCTDPGSLRDFPAFARQTGHELLDTRLEDGVHVFYVRKSGTR
ncbi:MAG: sulfurtransferase TusA family protein [Deltaproteobacteria bacterium]|nr:sulfurtransferase TusA family protein [Deltaproteobacteria bacterium]